MLKIIRSIPFQLFCTLLFSKQFVQAVDEVTDDEGMKIVIRWSNFEERESLYKLAANGLENRFELSLFSVDQFERLIATDKTGRYDFAMFNVPAPQIETENVVEVEEAKRRRKGKEIAGMEKSGIHIKNINEQLDIVKYELQIRINSISNWNNQEVKRKLKRLPRKNEILICHFNANPSEQCTFNNYNAKNILQPKRKIFFQMMDNLIIQRIECIKKDPKYYFFLKPLQNWADYHGSICLSDQYKFHILNKGIFSTNCDEAIYDIEGQTNIYQLKISNGTLECKLANAQMEQLELNFASNPNPSMAQTSNFPHKQDQQKHGQSSHHQSHQISPLTHPPFQHAAQLLESALTFAEPNHPDLQHPLLIGTPLNNIPRTIPDVNDAQFLEKFKTASSMKISPIISGKHNEGGKATKSKLSVTKQRKPSKKTQISKNRKETMQIEKSSTHHVQQNEWNDVPIIVKKKDPMLTKKSAQFESSSMHSNPSVDLDLHFRLGPPSTEPSNSPSSNNPSNPPQTQDLQNRKSKSEEIHEKMLKSLNILQETYGERQIGPFQSQQQIRRISMGSSSAFNVYGKGKKQMEAHQSTVSTNNVHQEQPELIRENLGQQTLPASPQIPLQNPFEFYTHQKGDSSSQMDATMKQIQPIETSLLHESIDQVNIHQHHSTGTNPAQKRKMHTHDQSSDLGLHLGIPAMDSSNPQSSKSPSKKPPRPWQLQIPLHDTLEQYTGQQIQPNEIHPTKELNVRGNIHQYQSGTKQAPNTQKSSSSAGQLQLQHSHFNPTGIQEEQQIHSENIDTNPPNDAQQIGPPSSQAAISHPRLPIQSSDRQLFKRQQSAISFDALEKINSNPIYQGSIGSSKFDQNIHSIISQPSQIPGTSEQRPQQYLRQNSDLSDLSQKIRETANRSIDAQKDYPDVFKFLNDMKRKHKEEKLDTEKYEKLLESMQIPIPQEFGHQIDPLVPSVSAQHHQQEQSNQAEGGKERNN